MGGGLYIDTLRVSGEDDLAQEDRFYYGYGAFHMMKGDILRASITHLKSIQSDINEKFKDKPDGARRFLLDAGIKAVKVLEEDDDKQSLTDAETSISAAVRILSSWVRIKRAKGDAGNLMFANERNTRFTNMGLFGASSGGFASMRGGLNVDEIMDNSYNSSIIYALIHCPVELERVGMRGVYILMKMPDNNIVIYPDEAKILASLFEILVPLLGGPESEGKEIKEMSEEFRGVLLRCKEGTILQG